MVDGQVEEEDEDGDGEGEQNKYNKFVEDLVPVKDTDIVM